MSLSKSFSLENAQEFAHAFKTAFDQGDYKAMASFYADNATLISDNSETLQGRRAIERFWQTVCEVCAAKKIRRTIHIQHIEVSSDLGFVFGSVYLETPVSPGQTNMISVPYVTLWKRQPDGIWRLTLDVSNRTPAS